MQAIFYGVSPAVIALILHSCYRLTKLGMKDWLEWALAAAAFVITVAGAGRGRAALHRLRHRRRALLRLALPRADHGVDHHVALLAVPPARRGRPGTTGAHARQALHVLPEGGVHDLWQRARHRALLEKGLVQQTGWLNEREFLVAVAMGMISPGPVVITATFVGYLVAGLLGRRRAPTIGIFLPSFLLILIVAPDPHALSHQPERAGLHQGRATRRPSAPFWAPASSWGESPSATGSLPSVALVSLVVLFRWKVSNPLLVAAAAVVGLIAFPLLRPEWIFVK